MAAEYRQTFLGRLDVTLRAQQIAVVYPVVYQAVYQVPLYRLSLAG